jgi:hypothetical protein
MGQCGNSNSDAKRFGEAIKWRGAAKLSLLGNNAFFKFWSDILGVEPGGASGTPDVRLCPIRHWCVETAQPQENVWLIHPLGNDVGTTSRAKATEFARR